MSSIRGFIPTLDSKAVAAYGSISTAPTGRKPACLKPIDPPPQPAKRSTTVISIGDVRRSLGIRGLSPFRMLHGGRPFHYLPPQPQSTASSRVYDRAREVSVAMQIGTHAVAMREAEDGGHVVDVDQVGNVDPPPHVRSVYHSRLTFGFRPG